MPEPERPDPDALLAGLTPSGAPAEKGRLKVFLGMCPGVGKTCAMLQEAAAWGPGVLAGVVETHGRDGTAALLSGMEVIPLRSVVHRGVPLAEFDLDAALASPAELILVDELAHTNVPGSRHPKRYQDVLELVAAGRHVFTTVNIQHLESQVDLVREITGVRIRETVPDSILDAADEIELVDLTPAALRERLAEGKIYQADQAEAAGTRFFREEHLTALREMALRYTAERVGQDVRKRWRNPVRALPKTSEKLLVAVGPSPHAEGLIRWTRRAAARLQCPWTAVSIETGAVVDEADRDRITAHLLLAKRLGAATAILGAGSVLEGIAQAARDHAATQIIIGKPERRRWWRSLRDAWQLHGFVVAGGTADLHLVRLTERPAPVPEPSSTGTSTVAQGSGVLGEWLEAALSIGAVTLPSLMIADTIGYRTVALLYLLTVLILALRLSRGPMLLAAGLSALTWNFLFIPPRFTFSVGELHDAVMLGLFLVLALVAGQITSRLRRQERLVRERERRTSILQQLTETLALGHDPEASLGSVLTEIESALDAEVCLFRRRNPAEMQPAPVPGGTLLPDAGDRAVAMWAYQQGQPAGRHTDTLPESGAMWIPLKTAAMTSGVLGIRTHGGSPPDLSERSLTAAITAQLAAALEKEHFLAAIRQADLTEQSNRLHKTLLDSVSHELKTPLAVLRAATERLQAETSGSGQSLVTEVSEASRRLKRVVDQLLDLTRLESGLLQPRLEWSELAELCATATQAAAIPPHTVRWHIPQPGVLVRTDPGMLETALINLLQNAHDHSPPGHPVEASAEIHGAILTLTVLDHGPGLPSGDPAQVFTKFYRGPDAPAGGLGLGLSIVQGLGRALGGTVDAASAPGGGAVFRLSLPVDTALHTPDAEP